MKRLTILVIVAALGWSGYWFWNANVQKSAIAAWFAARDADGWIADYSDLSISGFPNRLDTTLTAPRLGDPSADVVWQTPFLQLMRLSYNPSHLIAVMANTQTLVSPVRQTTVTTTDLRASLKIADMGTLSPERLIIVAEGLELSTSDARALSLDVSQFTAEALPAQNSYRVALDARGIAGALPGWINDIGAIDRLTADLEVRLSAPLTLSAIESGRPQPERIKLALAEAEWNGLRLAAAGEVEISEAGTPIGDITLKVRNWRDMLAAERQSGRLSTRALTQIEITLNVISGLSGNPETLDLPFEFKNGKTWLGPLVIGNAPIIRIP